MQFYAVYGILLTPVRERSLSKGAEIARTCIIKKWSQSGHVRIYLKIWKIYLDTCCLSRLFDPQTQPRIRQETEAIHRILAHIDVGDLHWVASKVLAHEVGRAPDATQSFEITNLLTLAHQTVVPGENEKMRGRYLELLGFKSHDALHLACAEKGEVDIFLTTDDQLLKAAARSRTQLRVRVENPQTWLQEVTTNERIRDDNT